MDKRMVKDSASGTGWLKKHFPKSDINSTPLQGSYFAFPGVLFFFACFLSKISIPRGHKQIFIA
jgi:hypothetical protein